MKKIIKMEDEVFIPEKKPMIGVNQAIRVLGIAPGRDMYFRKKYPKGTRFTIDEWKKNLK